MENWSGESLVAAIGKEACVALAEEYGGTRLYVPKQKGHYLAEVLGPEAFRSLVDEYGGTYLRVPLLRVERAQRLRAAGLSNARIAVRLGVTESAIDRMFKRLANGPAPTSETVPVTGGQEQ